MTSSAIHFYDAANSRNVPSGVHAAVYINGYAWSKSEIDRMGEIFCVSVYPEAYWAKYARCIDIEQYAAKPENLPAFVHERRTLGFNDATAYVNRSNWQAAWQAMKNVNQLEPLWWVATLDGTQNVELTVNGVVVAKAWAVQYEDTGGYDLSILHGVNNFHKP